MATYNSSHPALISMEAGRGSQTEIRKDRPESQVYQEVFQTASLLRTL